MAYALHIGMRYLRAKKKRNVSVITWVAITGVTLGVAALLVVLSITSGFQQEFRDKVLGVNAHVLVLKYGVDFAEYRDVLAKVRKTRQVVGAAPFVINEMMLAKGDRLAGVLVKGIDPESSPSVLDLPKQLRSGSLAALRLPGATPPVAPEVADELAGGLPAGEPSTGEPTAAGRLDAYLKQLEHPSGLHNQRAATHRRDAVEAGAKNLPAAPPTASARSLAVVPTPHQAEEALNGLSGGAPNLPNDEQEAELLAATANHNAPQVAAKLPGVVVGRALAAQLGLHLGDAVKIVSPLSGLDLSAWSSAAHAPRSRDFRIIGVFEAGFQEYDSRLVYIDLYEAQHFFDHGDAVTGVEIRMRDFMRAPKLAADLERRLGGSPFHTMDWAELNHNLFQALEMQKAMLSLVIATIIFVAAFNVIATLIMVVLEKKREVAILKAIGAKNRTVLGIFMLQGVVIGTVGTALGLLLGGSVCAYLTHYRFPLDPKVYLIDHLPIRSSLSEFLVTSLMALPICSLSTLIPSWWAARLPPAEGVRY